MATDDRFLSRLDVGPPLFRLLLKPVLLWLSELVNLVLPPVQLLVSLLLLLLLFVLLFLAVMVTTELMAELTMELRSAVPMELYKEVRW